MNVLVVSPGEDGPLVAAELRRWGHRAEVVQSGEHCIDRFVTEQFDAVALAIEQPGRSGAATIEALRWAPGGSEVRIVLWGTEASWVQVQNACEELDALAAPTAQDAARTLLFGSRGAVAHPPDHTRRYSVQAVQEFLGDSLLGPPLPEKSLPDGSLADEASAPAFRTTGEVRHGSAPAPQKDDGPLLGDPSPEDPSLRDSGRETLDAVSAPVQQQIRPKFRFEDHTEDLDSTEAEGPPIPLVNRVVPELGDSERGDSGVDSSTPSRSSTSRSSTGTSRLSASGISASLPAGLSTIGMELDSSEAPGRSSVPPDSGIDDAPARRRIDTPAAPPKGLHAKSQVPEGSDPGLEKRVNKVLRAERLYRRAQRFLERRELRRAIRALAEALTLRPGEAEFELLLAWTEHQDAPSCPTRLQRLHRAATVHRQAPRAAELLRYAQDRLGEAQ